MHIFDWKNWVNGKYYGEYSSPTGLNVKFDIDRNQKHYLCFGVFSYCYNLRGALSFRTRAGQ